MKTMKTCCVYTKVCNMGAIHCDGKNVFKEKKYFQSATRPLAQASQQAHILFEKNVKELVL